MESHDQTEQSDTVPVVPYLGPVSHGLRVGRGLLRALSVRLDSVGAWVAGHFAVLARLAVGADPGRNRLPAHWAIRDSPAAAYPRRNCRRGQGHDLAGAPGHGGHVLPARSLRVTRH